MNENNDTNNKQEKPPKAKGSANSSRLTLDIVDDGKNVKTPVRRVKPTVSVSKMQVTIPESGVKTKKIEERQPEKQEQKPAKETPAPTVKKPALPATRKKPAPKTKQAPASPTKKPVRKAPPKKKVVPPTIGKRKGYTPTVAYRLRFPIFLVAFLVCFFALFFAFHKGVGLLGSYSRPGKPLFAKDDRVEVTIEAGMSARSVSVLLKDLGIVDDPEGLLSYFVEQNLATTIRTGIFMMEKGMSFAAIGERLTLRTGELTIVVNPANTLATIDSFLDARGYARRGEFLKAVEKLQREHSLSFAEGWLLSGEYVVPQESAASSLAIAMFSAMLESTRAHLGSDKVAQWGLEQVLIIASMIQAETQNQSEMPFIASVIYNRLEAGEPLGIDATTRYELNDWKNPIPLEALETQTPYNTRRKVGLPPSGICCPSKAAVEAALSPLKTPYFYYLHGLDKQLHLATTYEGHKENIKAYR